jgi:Transcriptional regulators
MATIDDVVRVSGVSRSTVFRFLAGNQVRPAARGAIQTAMRDLGYSFDPRHSRSDILLLVSIEEHFEGVAVHADMVAGVMNRAASLGLLVKLHAGPGPLLSETEDAASAKKRVGVVIIGKSDSEEDAESAELVAAGVPHVFVNRIFDDPSRSFVGVDLRKAAREVVDHLLDRGYRDIGAWGKPTTYRLDREKMAGYAEAYEARGLPVPDRRFDYDEDGDLEPIARQLLDEDRFPEAWFGLSDMHIMRLGVVLRERGLRVPEDVALVGMDDQESSEFFSPPLTTVRIPFRQAGATAVDSLLCLLENPLCASMRILLKHELIVRESCGARMVLRE